MKTCVNCKKQVMNEYSTCPYCGNPVDKKVKVKPPVLPSEKPPLRQASNEESLSFFSEHKKIIICVAVGVLVVSLIMAILTTKTDNKESSTVNKIEDKQEEVVTKTEEQETVQENKEVEEETEEVSQTDEEAESTSEDIEDGNVFVVGSTKTYHKKNCAKIAGHSVSEMTLAQAKSYGYTPCKVCHPDEEE